MLLKPVQKPGTFRVRGQPIDPELNGRGITQRQPNTVRHLRSRSRRDNRTNPHARSQPRHRRPLARKAGL